MATTTQPATAWPGPPAQQPADVLGRLRDHRRPREGDDVQLALPARAARACSTARSSASRSTTGPSTTCASARASRSRPPASSVDDEVFDRFAKRLSYVSGDFADAGTFERVAAAIKGAQQPGLLPRDPAVPVRHGDRGARRRRPDRERPRRRREAVRPRPRLGAGAQRGDPRAPRRVPALPDRPLPRQDGPDRDPLPAVRERDASSRSGTATTSRRVQITMAEDFGVEDRGHFYDPVGALRDVVVNHLMQVVAAAAMEPPAGADAEALKDAHVRRVPGDARRRPGALRARPVRRLPRRSTAWRRTRRPRPTPRCGSRSTTGAGRACRSSSAPASTCRHADRAAARLPAAAARSTFRRRPLAPPGAGPDRGQARPLDRHPAAGRGAARRRARARADQPRHGVRARRAARCRRRTRCCCTRR